MELTNREKRAVMLETQTPAYARSLEARRAIDDKYRKAKNLRKAFAAANMDIPVHVRTAVPYSHQYVSGLNVPANLVICVGKAEIGRHWGLQLKAKRALNERNA